LPPPDIPGLATPPSTLDPSLWTETSPLRRARLDAAVSLSQMAARLGVSRTRAWQIEHQHRVDQSTYDRWMQNLNNSA
jgi:hypothetical protein